MANFKPGQRVRIRKDATQVQPDCLDVPGKEGVLLHPYGGVFRFPGRPEWVVNVIGHQYPEVIVPEEYLSPLTDPGFEQFMDRVMKPINEPVTA